MGGMDGQTYLGCTFPSNGTYRQLIQEGVRKVPCRSAAPLTSPGRNCSSRSQVGQYLASQGALGHFSVDFLARRIDAAKEGVAMRLLAERHTEPYGEDAFQEAANSAKSVEANCAIDEHGQLWDLHALEVPSLACGLLSMT